jgi:hypothetical protein
LSILYRRGYTEKRPRARAMLFSEHRLVQSLVTPTLIAGGQEP